MTSPAFDRTPTDYMRLLMERVPSMLAYWDDQLLCRYANRAYEVWFGVNPDALIGTSIRDLLGPRLFALNEPYIRGALGGREQLFERVVPGPDGVERHSLAHYIPDVVDGQVRGFMVLVTEVTQLKQTQAALRREQALHEQLRQHADELHRLLQERDEVLDVLAHEVRQPLNNASAALQSGAQLLAGLDTGAGARLGRAQAVLGQVLEQIDNTLAVSRLLARPGQRLLEDADVDVVVGLAIADIAEAERGRIRIDRRTSTRTASMSSNLIRLALRNLLVNALRYSGPGTPVTVRIDDGDEPLALLLDVVDQGPGIDADTVAQLFNRHARIRHDGMAPTHSLGLYIVRRVMEVHAGRAELVANTPDGVTVRLVIVQGLSDANEP